GGGQSLIPVLRFRMAAPEVLVDLGQIGALRQVREEGEDLVIGAMATHHAVAHDPLIGEHAPLLAHAAAAVADPQIRYRGTIGGALAHADPVISPPRCWPWMRPWRSPAPTGCAPCPPPRTSRTSSPPSCNPARCSARCAYPNTPAGPCSTRNSPRPPSPGRSSPSRQPCGWKPAPWPKPAWAWRTWTRYRYGPAPPSR